MWCHLDDVLHSVAEHDGVVQFEVIVGHIVFIEEHLVVFQHVGNDGHRGTAHQFHAQRVGGFHVQQPSASRDGNGILIGVLHGVGRLVNIDHCLAD